MEIHKEIEKEETESETETERGKEGVLFNIFLHPNGRKINARYPKTFSAPNP